MPALTIILLSKLSILETFGLLCVKKLAIISYIVTEFQMPLHVFHVMELFMSVCVEGKLLLVMKVMQFIFM
jgi:hypothetical protein